jgi:hypothetical protein
MTAEAVLFTGLKLPDFQNNTINVEKLYACRKDP